MNGTWLLYVNQYGERFAARTVRQLHERVGGGRISKMYRDTKAGAVHCGYVIGRHWLVAFQPMEIPA